MQEHQWEMVRHYCPARTGCTLVSRAIRYGETYCKLIIRHGLIISRIRYHTCTVQF